jgi:catechol 2,3-dioxygenase-like lactoylglutathione lyase family enzyme
MMKNTLLSSMKKLMPISNPFSLFLITIGRRLFGFILFLTLFGCDSQNFNKELGQIAAFAEVVNAGAKPMALSTPLSSGDMDTFYGLALAEAAKFNVEVFREDEFLATDLFPESTTANQEVLLLFQGTTLATYEEIKKDQKRLIDENQYEGAARRDIARRFGRLLGYQPSYINQLLSQNTAFKTLSDYGIQATNVFLYYKDLQRATEFYQNVLGLNLLGEYDNASMFQIADQSMLVLVDEAKGMHSANEDKSVALAFLTKNLPNWYAHLQAENVEIKYTYKPKEGGPHDGFVAVDPEGYFLEFEMFKTHKENEPFKTLLDQNEELPTSVSFEGTPLGFHGSITWLYHKDILLMQNFYEDVLGLTLVADQGWTKIYQGSDTGFIGLVDERRGMRDYADEKAVNMSFVLEDVSGWYDYVTKNEVMPIRNNELTMGPDNKYKAFVSFGPELYYYEFDEFMEHPQNQKVMEFLNK